MEIIKSMPILLPKKNIDLSKWAVVACDQYTSEKAYWENLSKYVGDSYSTLNIVFPEVYLGHGDENRIAKINDTMRSYIKDDIFDVFENCFVLVDRVTADGKRRLGLVIAVDLEEYDYSPSSNARIKATEGTVIERIPPRVKIRKNALLELPHVMLLMDDREQKIIESLYENKDKLEKLYDFDLNMNGGHIAGYKVDNVDEVINKIYGLLDKDYQRRIYGKETSILFSVGDGNHSLATAKTHWDNVKRTLSEKERENHPARYALCELVNLNGEGLDFEPIHRVVFGVTKSDVEKMQERFNEGASVEMVLDEETYYIKANENAPKAIDEIQSHLDELVKEGKASVDYVHGRQNTLDVAKSENGLAIFMPTIKKEELFSYIIEKGVLPRKSFSMGEANDKRYYLEAKYIVPNKEIK